MSNLFRNSSRLDRLAMIVLAVVIVWLLVGIIQALGVTAETTPVALASTVIGMLLFTIGWEYGDD